MHQLHQVFLGRADHPHINVDLMIFTDAAEGAVVEKAQQFGLHARRHFANFIQQNRAAVSLLEEALFPLDGVAEQLAFHRVFRDGAAVQRQIRFPCARTRQVAGVGQQIFPCAGIPDD